MSVMVFFEILNYICVPRRGEGWETVAQRGRRWEMAGTTAPTVKTSIKEQKNSARTCSNTRRKHCWNVVKWCLWKWILYKWNKRH